MLFSSSVFLFAFLPVVLAVYYLLLRRTRKGQNAFLTVASLFFYAWGEPWFVLMMMGSIVVNYLLGRLAGWCRTRGKPLRIAVIPAVAANLSVLFVFKYLTFTLRNLNLLGFDFNIPVIELPIGISFFTFQALSYVLDVARGRGEAQRSLLNVGLYISFFPQLIAGPIVKYETVAWEIEHRRENWDDFSSGICRFLLGLAKKVILSNQLAVVADAAFDQSGTLSVSMAWLGGLCYILQLYFDFGGYSDMAIGLGKMFGFHFLENFNYPYTATSISDFWRRWHISMTDWFRDYVYYPLGGNRVDRSWKVLRNLFVVWFLTGLWHGANWTFIVWGLLNFGLLMWEKYGHLGRGAPKAVGWCYTFVAFILTCVVFRSDSLGDAVRYLMDMFHLGAGAALWSAETGLYFRENWIILLGAALASAPTATWIRAKLEKQGGTVTAVWDGLCSAATLALFAVSVCLIVKGTYNPFIYFNF